MIARLAPLMAVVRAVLAALLLTAETLITWPIFVVAWLGSALWLSVQAGYRFANLTDEQEKRTVLRKMMGERSSR